MPRGPTQPTFVQIVDYLEEERALFIKIGKDGLIAALQKLDRQSKNVCITQHSFVKLWIMCWILTWLSYSLGVHTFCRAKYVNSHVEDAATANLIRSGPLTGLVNRKLRAKLVSSITVVYQWSWPILGVILDSLFVIGGRERIVVLKGVSRTLRYLSIVISFMISFCSIRYCYRIPRSNRSPSFPESSRCSISVLRKWFFHYRPTARWSRPSSRYLLRPSVRHRFNTDIISRTKALVVPRETQAWAHREFPKIRRAPRSH